MSLVGFNSIGQVGVIPLSSKGRPDRVGALAPLTTQEKLTEEGLFPRISGSKLYHNSQERSGWSLVESGAVIRDIITTVTRRFPGVEILLFPTRYRRRGIKVSPISRRPMLGRTDI